MLNQEIQDILTASNHTGWVLEPQAKKILSLSGIQVPQGELVTTTEQARQRAQALGYPLVAKVVSPKIIHKSEYGGVRVGIGSDEELVGTLEEFASLAGFAGMLMEKMVPGLELIIGAQNDHQFGPVILLGIGGTGVEIYQDTALRMAPITKNDVASMINCLAAREFLYGFRGSKGVNFGKLEETLVRFSDLIMDMGEWIESVDLNPVMASETDCVVADARIILRQ
jgi:succinyl-CoA synthetase beta subunit